MGRQSDKIVIEQRHRFRRGLMIVGLCMLVGIGYPVLDKEFNDALAFVNGGVIGLLGGIGMAVHQDFSLYGRIRRQHFLSRLFLVSLLYTVGFALLIIMVTGFTGSIENEESFISHVRGPIFRDFLFKGDFNVILLYALILSSAMSFIFSMQRKVDAKVLWNMVSGKYVVPREEDRIFMFMDMNESTKIAEKLGEIRYFEFINDFFTDVTPAILKTEGRIYRYVGDEIVVTWPMKNNSDYAKSIRTYFLARNEMKRQKEKYFNRYGILPSFKAVFHCGTVIVGEIGDVKSQLVFHGDMMYTMGLIEKQCHELGKSLLVSSTLINQVTLPKLYKVKLCGVVESEVNENIDLYSITERSKIGLT